MSRFVLLALVLLTAGRAADAATSCEDGASCNPGTGVAVRCDKEKGTVLIRTSCISETWNKSCSREGVYSLWDLLTVGNRGEEKDRVMDTRTVTHICEIAGGKFTVEIRPEVFNAHVLGHCGAAPTAKVILNRGGERLFSRSLVRDCDRGPSTTSIQYSKPSNAIVEQVEYDPAFSDEQTNTSP